MEKYKMPDITEINAPIASMLQTIATINGQTDKPADPTQTSSGDARRNTNATGNAQKAIMVKLY